MKLKLKHITLILTTVTIIAGLGIKCIDLYNNFESFKKDTKEQVISSNKTIQVHKDSIFGLVEVTEICETTRKILKANEILSLEALNDYEYLIDSLSYVLEFKISNIRTINKPTLPKLSVNISLPEIKGLKSHVLKSNVEHKKRLFKRIFK